MSDETLRDLLEERVADLTTRDLATTAWSEGVRRRRTRRLTTLAGVVAATALTVGVTALVGGSASDGPPPAERPAPAEPDAVVGDVPVWWSPSLAEEASLRQVDSVLPAQVDLDEQAPEAAGTTGPAARAAFAVLDGARADHLLLVGDGPRRTLDLSRLDPVAKPNGYLLPPVSDTMLAPDGRTLAFGQDGAVAFFDVTLGTWRDVPVDAPTHELRWVGPRLLALANGDVISVDGTPVDLDPPVPTVLAVVEPASPQGPWVSTADGLADAQAFGYGAADVPVRPGSTQQPETVVVQDAAAPDVLAITAEVNDGRFKDCCPVAGWLDGDTVVYESRSARPRLISWDVGTRTFGRVTTLVGLADPDASYVGSYAQLDAIGSPPATDEPDAGTPEPGPAEATRRSAPSPADEADLPAVSTHLPAVVGPAADVPDAETDPLRLARVAVAVPGTDRVLLVEDDDQRLLDISPAGSPLTDRSLSPSGRFLLFPQADHLLAFDVPAGRWRRFDTGTDLRRHAWMRTGDAVMAGSPGPVGRSGGLTLPDLAPQMGQAMTHWVDRRTSYGIATHGWAMEPREVAEATSEPTRDGGTISVAPLLSGEQELVLEGEGRPAGCCPMVGFLDGEVLYESRSAARTRLLRWVVGTDDVGLVTTVATDGPVVASWAAFALP